MQASSNHRGAVHRFAPSELLSRYARGRLAYFWMRQGLTLTGAVTLALLVDPWLGAIALSIALLGEGLDCWALSRVLRAVQNGAAFEKVSRWAALSAAAQATSISICVLLTWLSVPDGGAVHFCIAFLVSAALNAGIVWPFHPPSAIARLSVFAATAALGFLIDFSWRADISKAQIFDAVGHLLMVYLVFVVLRHVVTSHTRHETNTEKILRSKRSLQKTHAQLLASQREAHRLSLVASHANDSIVLSDRQRRIIWVNQAFEQLTGFSREEAMGRTPGDLFNGEKTDATIIAKIHEQIESGHPFRTEILNYRKDGEEIWVDTNLVPVFGIEGEDDLIVAIERDITAIKQHEKELADAMRAAERGERAKTEFLATMSHEIRTPMNGIIGLSDLLSECDLSDEALSYVRTVQSSAEALLTILNDILDYSKLDAGKLSIEPNRFDLGQCIHSAVHLFENEAAQKGIFVDVIHDTVLPQTVMGDEGRLRQILLNLVGNAIKFTNRGGVTLKTRIEDTRDGLLTRISVTDTGIGIAADQLDGIFEKFSQADGQTTGQFGGTGLGLAISRLLAQHMGGDISVTSDMGAGSTFEVSLVLHRPQDESPSTETMSVPEQDIAKLVVLVAEDNETNRFLIKKYLKNTAIDLRFAMDGMEAVEQALCEKPDVIFMDMAMPRMDGLGATREIRRQLGPQPHIIALTANAFLSDRDACLSAGMDDFLAKPVRKSDLLSKLASLGPNGSANAKSA